MNESNKWDYVRIKDVCSMQSGTNITSLDISETGDYPVYGGNGMRGYYEKFNTQNEVILVGRQGALAGNVHITNKKIWATDHAVVTKTHFDYDTKFLYYALYAMNLNQYANDTAAQPGLAVSKIQRLFIINPPLAEQKQIVSYLDAKTSEIDSKIAVLTKKRDAYLKLKTAIINRAVTQGLNPDVKLKPSGIDWLGEVPEHWKIKRYKDFFRNSTKGFTPESKDETNFSLNEKYTWITIGDLTNKYLFKSSLCLSDKIINKKEPKVTKQGSLMFSFKLSVGKVAFAGKNLYTNEAIMSIPPQQNVCLTYMYYLLPFVCNVNATENIYGAKMLNQQIIANIKITLPPLQEQKKIADYLNKKCMSIDKVTIIIGKQIEAYKHLRRSLINEVITGQRTIQ